MELISFWVVNPADGQNGIPEPVKLILMENGDIELVSLSEEPDYRGAYKLPCGSYAYSGESIKVSGENLGKIMTVVPGLEDDAEYRSRLYSAGLVNDREWDLFFANRPAWKSLRLVAIAFGDE